MAARLLTISTLGLLAALAACNEPADSRELLLAGERSYEARKYHDAIEQLTRFVDSSESHDDLPRALYVRGMAHALGGDRDKAYADLIRAVREADGPPIDWHARQVLGVLYFEDQKWRSAAAVLTEAVQRMPGAPPMDALLYRIGLCYERQGLWRAAQTPYRHILRNFPDGAYAAAARRRLELNADHFAVQVGVFSSRENADRLVAELRDQGLETYVRRELRRGESFHVVLHGRYQSYSQAVADLARVRGHVPAAVLWP
jgi:tetratricopeptide (TPR) repeat protein